MARSTLDLTIENLRSVWGPLSTEVVDGCRRHLAGLLEAPATEDWLTALHADAPPSQELHRDPDHGFVLLAHTEQAGLYRPPHDHGRGWVVYAIQRGETEMGEYGRLVDEDMGVRLVKKSAALLRPGQVQVYLPGDIHDTRCVTGPALLFRFTERDLRKADEARRVTRYVERDGRWTLGAT